MNSILGEGICFPCARGAFRQDCGQHRREDRALNGLLMACLSKNTIQRQSTSAGSAEPINA